MGILIMHNSPGEHWKIFSAMQEPYGQFPPTLSKSIFGQRQTQMRRVMSCSRGDNSNIVREKTLTTYKKNSSRELLDQFQPSTLPIWSAHISFEQRGVFIIAHRSAAHGTGHRMLSSYGKDRSNLHSFYNGQGILKDVV